MLKKKAFDNYYKETKELQKFNLPLFGLKNLEGVNDFINDSNFTCQNNLGCLDFFLDFDI